MTDDAAHGQRFAASQGYLISLVNESDRELFGRLGPPDDNDTIWLIRLKMRAAVLAAALTPATRFAMPDSEAVAMTYLPFAQWAERRFGDNLDAKKIVGDSFARAVAWASEREQEEDILLMTDDRDRMTRFVSEREGGLSCALLQLGIYIRRDLRSQADQILNEHGQWTPINDLMEAGIRELIRRRFSFRRESKKIVDGARSVDANWSNSQWRTVYEAALATNQVDSFTEWLTELPAWDRQPRLDDWLHHVGFRTRAEYLDLTRWAARAILLVACARTLRPGLKHDEMPVLIGPQGCGKSTALSCLFPDDRQQEWFSDELRLASDEKRRVESLLGKVIVEAAEMTGVTTADIETIKAFMSRVADHMRLAFRKNPETLPRRVSIVGTANGHSVLPSDPTGNRRFVSVLISDGNPTLMREWLTENREQLWAEAYHLARLDTPTRLPAGLTELQRKANAEVESSDTLLEDRVEEIVTDARNAHPRISTLSAHFVARKSGLVRDDQDTTVISVREQRRLARAMERMKWKSARVWNPEKARLVRSWVDAEDDD